VVVVADADTTGRDHSVALVDSALDTTPQFVGIVAGHAEVDRQCAIGLDEGEQTGPVGVSDARWPERPTRDLVASRHHADAKAWDHPRAIASDGREDRDVLRVQSRAPFDDHVVRVVVLSTPADVRTWRDGVR
jgi:hypothetical protein